jgi:3-deoxy-D-manno-octulosonate 8-phosphate phosphatase (KDO 8-P phosphatase)
MRFLIPDFRFRAQPHFNVPRSKPQKRRSPVRKSAWAGLRLFAMDVDGVLTDGRVHIHSDGTESKAFSILDGLGLVRLRQAGLELAWVSGRISGATAVRAAELKIPHLIQGRTDKLAALRELSNKLGLAAAQVCYMGDDDIDAPAIAWAGIGVAPATAMAPALAAADFVPNRAAGHGAVREVCEQILSTRGQETVT